MQETVIRYSEAFKLKGVKELEDGKLTSIKHAKREYGVRSSLTVTRWLKKYGWGHLLSRKVRIETNISQQKNCTDCLHAGYPALLHRPTARVAGDEDTL